MLGTHKTWESDGPSVPRFIFIFRVRHRIRQSYFLVLAAPPHQRSAKNMKHVPIAWNVVRVLLIVICCFQLTLHFLDTMQAARMLTMKEGTEEYRRTQAPLDTDGVAEVLMRRGPSSFNWLVALGILALLPYAPISRFRRR
jgi:hypothetical protein